MNTQKGFTIVELLIVIVVIGILAAITIVAYNGIQNRTNDTAVKSDLRNFGNKILEYQAINGNPVPLATADLQSLNFKATTRAYGAHYNANNGYNFLYCRVGDAFAIVGASKSGRVFAYRSQGGLVEDVPALNTFTTTCPDNGVTGGASPGVWGFNNGAWASWAG